MDELKKSIIKDIESFIIQFKDHQNCFDLNAYINYYQGLNVTHSLGFGNLSFVPFIAFLGDKQETQNGIYPVILFYRRKRIVVLAYGISATNKPKYKWETNNNSIGELFSQKNIKGLKSTEKNYLDSKVYKFYNLDSLKTEELVNDLDVIIKEYKSILLKYGLSNNTVFKRPPRTINELKTLFMPEKLKWDNINEDETNHLISEPNLEIQNTSKFSPIQKIYFGTPGGGKSYKVKKLIEEEHKAKERHFRTTFHPDTDYASFVGSYKPVMKGNDITYEFIPQVFTLAYIAAWNDLKNEYFLNIEEINRGNCAQIFGDLFQLLDRNDKFESEYPIKADTDLYNYLQYGKNKNGAEILINKDGIKDGKLKLPSNLSIVATMNTSDQSLFPMDSAFKRRWDWEFVPSKKNEKDNYVITIGENKYKWHTFLDYVNEKIKEVTDSEDKQLGCYFIKSNMDEDKFKSKVMFYLWSEVCKDEYKTPNNFFRYKDNDNKEHEFTFNDLYKENSIAILQGFMKYLEEDYNNKSKQ